VSQIIIGLWNEEGWNTSGSYQYSLRSFVNGVGAPAAPTVATTQYVMETFDLAPGTYTVCTTAWTNSARFKTVALNATDENNNQLHNKDVTFGADGGVSDTYQITVP
jgi:hypothetical protein